MSIRGIFPIEQWDFNSESILADLPAGDLEILTRRKSELFYKKGEVLFREGAYPGGIFYLTKGRAKKYKIDFDGREQIIYVANTGELLGYHALLSASNYVDSAAVLEDSIVAFIPREDFLTTLDQSPVLNKRLLRTLSHEFAVLSNSLTMFAKRSVRERLALQLIIIREKYKDTVDPGMPIEISLGRDDLANLVGTARENVVRMLSEFKSEGTIQTNGRKITVTDVKRLIQIANYSMGDTI